MQEDADGFLWHSFNWRQLSFLCIYFGTIHNFVCTKIFIFLILRLEFEFMLVYFGHMTTISKYFVNSWQFLKRNEGLFSCGYICSHQNRFINRFIFVTAILFTKDKPNHVTELSWHTAPYGSLSDETE